MCDARYFMAAAWKCHRVITWNANFARARGFIIERPPLSQMERDNVERNARRIAAMIPVSLLANISFMEPSEARREILTAVNENIT